LSVGPTGTAMDQGLVPSTPRTPWEEPELARTHGPLLLVGLMLVLWLLWQPKLHEAQSAELARPRRWGRAGPGTRASAPIAR
jgi:hypothetical protein